MVILNEKNLSGGEIICVLLVNKNIDTANVFYLRFGCPLISLPLFYVHNGSFIRGGRLRVLPQIQEYLPRDPSFSIFRFPAGSSYAFYMSLCVFLCTWLYR